MPPVLPPEIIALILHHLYALLHPTSALDPPLRLQPISVQTILAPLSRSRSRSSAIYNQPPQRSFDSSLTTQFKNAFLQFSQVNRLWHEIATPLLWRHILFGMPAGFQSVIRTVYYYNPQFLTDIEGESDPRHRSTSPLRERGERDASTSSYASFQPLMQTPHGSPLLYTHSISFSSFRSAGLSRSIHQSSNERFVTSFRLLALLKSTRSTPHLLLPGDQSQEQIDHERHIARGSLEVVGFTEFMDSAISKDVLNELLMRGGYLAEYEEAVMNHIEDPDDVWTHSSVLEEESEEGTEENSEVEEEAFSRGRESIDEDSLGREGRSRTRRDGTERTAITEFRARELGNSISRSPDPMSIRALSLVIPDILPAIVHDEDEDAGENDQEHWRDRSVSEEDRGRTSTRITRFQGGDNMAATVNDQEPSSQTVILNDEPSGQIETEDDTPVVTMRSASVPAVHFPRRASVSVVREHKERRPSIFRSPTLSRPRYFPISFSHSQSRSSPRQPKRSSSVPAPSLRQKLELKTTRYLEGSKQIRPIRALDLCGCVSSVFVKALEELAEEYKWGPEGTKYQANAPESKDEEDAVGDTVFEEKKMKRIMFPHLRRLGLHTAMIPANLLTPFVLSFPYLTHLDLSETYCSPLLLKRLAISGQEGHSIGGRVMRLKSLNLGQTRILTGASLVGFLCGDSAPFTSVTDDEFHSTSWGRGEVVSQLVELALYGDSTEPLPLSQPELRLILSTSPAFLSGHLRFLDLSSAPFTDETFSECFPSLPNLIILGLANCRGITMAGVAELLITKCPNVEILDLSNSCPSQARRLASAQRRALVGGSIMSIMELHTQLLGAVASTQPTAFGLESEGHERVKARKTMLRVVELDEKALEAVQGGAGDWKVVWGRGRRGWYVDTGVESVVNEDNKRELRFLPNESEKREELRTLSGLKGVVPGEVGWVSRKMEVLRGEGMFGREEGLYAFHSLS